MVFQRRYIPEAEDIFQELKNIRQKHCISLEKIHRQTKIPIKYLKSLEEGSMELLPDVLYIKNIIKKYLGVFNIDAGPYLARLCIHKTEKQYAKRIINTKPLIVVPRLIKTVLAVILIIGFIGYLGYKINKIFQPPQISIYAPADGISVNMEILEVWGKTEKGVSLFINNEQVMVDKNGEFKKEINLQKGLNPIKISGVRRYSKENVIWRNVILEIK